SSLMDGSSSSNVSRTSSNVVATSASPSRTASAAVSCPPTSIKESKKSFSSSEAEEKSSSSIKCFAGNKYPDVEPLSENAHTLPSKSSSESIPESSRTTYCALYVPDPSRMDFKITFTSYCSLANTYPKAGINAI